MSSETEISKIWDRLRLHKGPPHSRNLAQDYVAQHGDIITTSYPRSGRTWLTHILWSLKNEGKRYPNGKQLYKEYMWLEMEGTEEIMKTPAPRVLTSHLPMDLIPMSPEAKYIIIIRNPKDVAVSFFYHNIGFGFTDGCEWKRNEDFDTYLQLFLDGEVIHGSYFDHLKSYMPFLDKPNVKLIFYEQMLSNGPSVVKDLAKFLGLGSAEDPTFIARVVESSSIKEMKTNQDRFFPSFAWKKKEYGFIREGTTGTWKDRISEVKSKQIDEKFCTEISGYPAEEWWKDVMRYS